MASRIILNATGTADVMHVQHTQPQAPGPGQVWLEQTAMGVNPLDVLQRKGGAPLALPSGLGLEGAGRVSAVGEGVDNVRVGDRVAYAMGPVGGYASGRLFPAERLVKLPGLLGEEAAAAVLFKGITAQYLLKSTYAVGPGTQVLLYGAGGALGQLMASWARHLGATVIGVVSRPQSVERARAAGCHHVLVFDAATLARQVRELAQGEGVDVVYDCVGKVSLEASLDSLRPRGLLVSFGGTSGAPAAIGVATLNAKGSLYLTRPSLAAHTRTVAEYQQRAGDVLAAVAEGIIQPRVWRRYPLAEAARAHTDLEQGLSEGALILTA
ncbi:quinone oxidoreductase family protein [Pseudomonas putida]|uniref:quinone oxidoreductase family protein n=1 Tax=Pseudomonas putida TaxID=303 RepID=UPI0021F81C72|nr:quinone oxidoreductase [Pseudomonas putida]